MGGSSIGSVLGAIAGYALAPETGGASAALASAAIGSSIGGAAGGMIDQAHAASNPSSGGSPVQTAPPAPPPAPTQSTQPALAPQVQRVKTAQGGVGQAGGSPGVAQTLLAGPGGVDPGLLTLGKNTLLGS